MKGYELLVKALRDKGVKYIFGYTGGAIMPVFDEMEKQGCFEFIMARHEQGAAFMAQGLSRASLSTDNFQIGVCMATSGPGAMNLVTGIADAVMDSVPVLSITGQVATSVIATDAFQESDVIGVMIPITKQTYMPLSASEIEQVIHEAVYLATTGRCGPVAVDVPKDIQLQETDPAYCFECKVFKPEIPGYFYQALPEREKIKKAVMMINRSTSPLILCGHGVITANAGSRLETFAERTNIPIAFTLHGLSSMEVDHPLSLGMVGMHGTVEANRAVMNTDLIIALGMRFDDRVTGKLEEYARDAEVIHVEIDPSEIDKNVATSLAINADVSQALDILLEEPELTYKPRRNWFHRISTYRSEIDEELRSEIETGVGSQGQLLMKTIVKRLSDITDGRDIIVADVGQHQMMAARFYNFQTFNSWFTSGGAGTMGAALPMAVGARLARPHERIWVICGDGGFQMNLQELGTIMAYGIDINILLFNNGYLGMVRQWQTLFFDGRYAGTPIQNPDFGSIAKAYGIAYRQVSTLDQIDDALQTARDQTGAHLLEFVCDPNEVILPMIPSGGGFGDMIVSLQSTKTD